MKNLNLLSILLFASIAFVSCDNSAKQNQFTLLSSNDTGVDFTNAILKDVEKKIIKKLYTNDLSKIKIENFSDNLKLSEDEMILDSSLKVLV